MRNQTTLSRIIPFAIFIAFLALADLMSGYVNAGFLLWLYPIKILLVAVCLIRYWKSYQELKVTVAPLDLAYALFAGVIVFIIWVLPYPAWLGGYADPSATMPVASNDVWMQKMFLFFRFFGSAFAVPLIEELFWRSFLMRWLTNRNFLSVNPANVSTFAYLATATLFAFEHQLWLAGLIAGLTYGELYKTYQNLWVPIIAHMTTNYLLACWVLSTGQWQYW